MSRNGILVNGQLVNIPGVYPHVDVSAMTPPALGVTGVLLVIAPSDGGLPDTIYQFATYDDAASVVRGGRILSYLARMFQPSEDENVSGTSNVKFIRANPSMAQASISVPTANTHPVTIKAADAGAWTNGIRVTVAISSTASTYVLNRDSSPVYYYPITVTVEDVPDNQSYSYALEHGINLTAPTGSTMTIDSTNQLITLSTNSSLVESAHFVDVATLDDLVSWINNHSGWSATCIGPSYMPTWTLSDNTTSVPTVANLAIFFPAESGAMAYLLNSQCPVVSVAQPAVSDNLSALSTTYMTGGLGKGSDTMGTSEVTAAIAIAATTRADLVWIQSSDPDCQALLKIHCLAMSTDVARKYRIGITGVNFQATSPYDGAVAGASSNDNAIAIAAATAKTLAGPMVYCLNGTTTANPVTGVQEMLGGLGLAAQIAGMKSGTPVGTPLTNKQVTSTGTEFANLTDAQKTTILNSGITTVFYNVDEEQTLILQAITTYQSTNPMRRNLGGCYIVQELARQEILLLSKFIGYPLDIGTGNLIKMAMAKALDGFVLSGSNPNGFLTKGRRKDGTILPAWEGLSVTGDSTTGAWTIAVEPHPIGETDFIVIQNKLTPATIEL
jgi:spore germination protein GerM